MISEFTSDSPPEILASLHRSDFAPYVSGSYSDQWNALELPHDKHMSHSSCILREMEVEESLLGFMATIALLSIYESKSTYDIGIWVNSTGFFFWEIPSLDGVLVGFF